MSESVRTDGRVAMWEDDILQEIYRVREEYAKSFDYDLQAICDDLRKQEIEGDREMITAPLRQRRT
jgi:hypothetical protein